MSKPEPIPNGFSKVVLDGYHDIVVGETIHIDFTPYVVDVVIHDALSSTLLCLKFKGC